MKPPSLGNHSAASKHRRGTNGWERKAEECCRIGEIIKRARTVQIEYVIFLEVKEQESRGQRRWDEEKWIRDKWNRDKESDKKRKGWIRKLIATQCGVRKTEMKYIEDKDKRKQYKKVEDKRKR
jgi:hypothetical protein